MRHVFAGLGLLASGICVAPVAGHGAEGMAHDAVGAALSFADLKSTVAALDKARAATEKYQDVRAAEADGYRAIGGMRPGMGIHYVRSRAASGFDIANPPILLYEQDEGASQGLGLVGVAYMVDGPAGPDGQPAVAPFPRALAAWHKHYDICLLPGSRVQMDASATDCREQGGRFIAETPWMVHAWIWKDSPAGVFSPTNPNVR